MCKMLMTFSCMCVIYFDHVIPCYPWLSPHVHSRSPPPPPPNQSSSACTSSHIAVVCWPSYFLLRGRRLPVTTINTGRSLGEAKPPRRLSFGTL